MNWYLNSVVNYPLLTAVVQFAILGTLGEFISFWIVRKKFYNPFSWPEIFWKMTEWGFLAVLIKYAFIGYQGFIDSLVAHHFLPEMSVFFRSLALSVAMNLQFGMLLVIFHRILDNVFKRDKNWQNIDKGLYSLIWFWVPAHTITFILPKDFQIGLAALWSVALGAILGYFNRKRS
ncbi:MAG: hypothetical protein JXQ65_14035 [Candidatus Marinimicrobia bacterium]|nr:hypothetical protein [Candidatus Neomarinimicrobiota bacterium]